MAKSVEQRQVDRAPGGALGRPGIHPVRRRAAVAVAEESLDFGEAFERTAGEVRQDAFGEQLEGAVAALAGDVFPR